MNDGIGPPRCTAPRRSRPSKLSCQRPSDVVNFLYMGSFARFKKSRQEYCPIVIMPLGNSPVGARCARPSLTAAAAEERTPQLPTGARSAPLRADPFPAGHGV